MAYSLLLSKSNYLGFIIAQSLRDSVSYVVDLSDMPKCGSFNPYGNEQMESEPKVEMDVKPGII